MNTNTAVTTNGARLLGWVVAGAMTAAITYGIASGGFVDGLRTVLGDPWGRVTMIDLGAGLLILGAWIGARERSVRRAVPWWIALVFTGNLAAGIYIIRAARRADSLSHLLTGEAI